MRVDRIVVALDERRGKLPVEQLLFCRLKGIPVDDGATFTENLCGRLPVENLYPSSLIFSDGFKRSLIIRRLKRFIDISCSLAGLLILSPLSLAVSAAIKFESEGPVFYRQERIGKHGMPFENFEIPLHAGGCGKKRPCMAAVNDERITKVGRVIRRAAPG